MGVSSLMKFAVIIIFISVILFPLLIINLKVSYTVLKSKDAEFSKAKVLSKIWLFPFIGCYFATKKVNIDWGKEKHDDTSGPYGTIGNGNKH